MPRKIEEMFMELCQAELFIKSVKSRQSKAELIENVCREKKRDRDIYAPQQHILKNKKKINKLKQ